MERILEIDYEGGKVELKFRRLKWVEHQAVLRECTTLHGLEPEKAILDPFKYQELLVRKCIIAPSGFDFAKVEREVGDAVVKVATEVNNASPLISGESIVPSVQA